MSGNRDCENDNVKTNSVFAINSSYFRDGRQYHPRKKQKRTKIYKKNKEKRQKKKEKDNKKEKKEKKIKIHTQRKDAVDPPVPRRKKKKKPTGSETAAPVTDLPVMQGRKCVWVPVAAPLWKTQHAFPIMLLWELRASVLDFRSVGNFLNLRLKNSAKVLRHLSCRVEI